MRTSRRATTGGVTRKGGFLLEYARPAKNVRVPESASAATIAAGEAHRRRRGPCLPRDDAHEPHKIAKRASNRDAARRTEESCHRPLADPIRSADTQQRYPAAGSGSNADSRRFSSRRSLKSALRHRPCCSPVEQPPPQGHLVRGQRLPLRRHGKRFELGVSRYPSKTSSAGHCCAVDVSCHHNEVVACRDDLAPRGRLRTVQGCRTDRQPARRTGHEPLQHRGSRSMTPTEQFVNWRRSLHDKVSAWETAKRHSATSPLTR